MAKLSLKADLAEGNVNVIVLPLKRCLDSWETCQGCLKALRIQRVKMVKWTLIETLWNIPILKFHAIFEFYLSVACWKPMCLLWLWFGVLDWSNTQRLGLWSTLWLLRDLSRQWALFVKGWNEVSGYGRDIWCVKPIRFSWGATLQLDAIFARHRYWNSKILKERVAWA